MYRPEHRDRQHHLATFGGLDKFGYKDFIPLFTAEHFNPDEWVDLFVRAGAKFAGPVAEHADGFSMWSSEVGIPSNFPQSPPSKRREALSVFYSPVRARPLE